eukprot:2639536-Rhodomonas_salina.2
MKPCGFAANHSRLRCLLHEIRPSVVHVIRESILPLRQQSFCNCDRSTVSGADVAYLAAGD